MTTNISQKAVRAAMFGMFWVAGCTTDSGLENKQTQSTDSGAEIDTLQYGGTDSDGTDSSPETTDPLLIETDPVPAAIRPTNVRDACAGSPAFSSDARNVLRASNDFGIRLFKETDNRTPSGNILISPLSLHMVWDMVLNGAVGSAAVEVQETLGLSGSSIESINAGCSEILDHLGEQDVDVTLEQATSLWVSDANEGFVKPEYTQKVSDIFDAPVTTLDLTSDASRSEINDWVAQKTDGHIADLVNKKLAANTVLLLIDALYFNAPWTFAFNKADTVPGTFTTDSGVAVQVPMMNIEAGLRFFSDENVKMVELPYSWGIYGMSIVMPADDRTLDQVVATLSGAQLKTWLDASWVNSIKLSLPKFEFSCSAINDDSEQLVAALKSMGIAQVFQWDDTALSAMLNIGGDVVGRVSDVKQKTFIKVDEEGAEAAAASLVEIAVLIDGDGSHSVEMKVDHPFLFTIHDRCTGAILFIGRMNNPTAL